MSLSSLQSPRATDPEDDCGAHAEQGVDGRDELPSFLDEAGTLVPPARAHDLCCTPARGPRAHAGLENW